jgi:hypothetical protein
MKTFVSAAIALVFGITALLAPSSHAQPGRRGGTPRPFVGGTVLSVNLGSSKKLASFMLKTRDGKSVKVAVTAKTTYRSGMNAATWAIVKKGVSLVVQLPKAGVYTAVSVMKRGPEIFAGGVVQSTKAGTNKKLASFVIKGRDGKMVTIKVTPKTKYMNAGKPATAAIVKKGAHVGVMLPKAGASEAVSVFAGMRAGGRGGQGGPR